MKNFLNSSLVFKQQKFRFSSIFDKNHSISERYDPSSHSLLKQIFTYPYDTRSVAYLITDQNTKSIIAIDPGDSEIAKKNIEFLQEKLKYNFTHIFTTHYHQDSKKASEILRKLYPNIEVVIGNYGSTNGFHTKKINEIQPFSIGDLAICLLHTPGHTDDSCCIAITHISENSTKLPVIFTGDTLHIGKCGNSQIEDHKKHYQSLEKLKNFPNETLIFPAEEDSLNNLMFVKTLDPKNDILNMKIKLADQAFQAKKINVPTMLYEEKMVNPYLRCNEKYYKDLVNEKDPIRVFTKLKKLEELLFKPK